MELTMASVPISREILGETGVTLSLALKPNPRSVSSRELPVHIDEIGRCRTCNAYQNIYSPFDERGYVCTFCYSENSYAERRNSRYLGRANRAMLPELQGGCYDVSLDDRDEWYGGNERGESADEDPGADTRPGAGTDRVVLGTTVHSAYVAVVDVCGGAEVVEEFRSALLTVLDELSESQYFALVLLDESAMYVMNWTASRFHTVRCTDDAALRGMAERVALHDILGRVEHVKKAAGVLISQLEPKPVKPGHEHLHSCYLGEAIKALLGYFVKADRGSVEHLDVNGRMIGSRIALFLSGVPSKGLGRVRSLEDRAAEEETGFYQDPINPEFAMANLKLDSGAHEPREKSAESAAGTSPPYQNAGILDEDAWEFYTGAGAAAAVAGIGIDVYVVGQGSNLVGAENLTVMATLSGGECIVYENDSVTLAEDIYDMLRQDAMLDCSIKIRTSAELQILGTVDYNITADVEQKDLFHTPRLPSDVLIGGIFLDVCDTGLGLSNRPPVYLQAAVRFTRIDDGRLKTCLRVITCEVPHATSVGSALLSHNVDLTIFSVFIGAMSIVGLHGRDEAATTLDRQHREYTAKRRAYLEYGDYVGDRGKDLGPDVFGYGMHRLITILDGGGAAGEFEQLERLFYYGRRGPQTVEGLLALLMGAHRGDDGAQTPIQEATVTTG